MEFREDVCLGMKRPISPPLMNGGGCCKTVEDVEKLSRSTAGTIVGGSYTMEGGSGNPGDVWWVEDDTGLNSLGMPSGGRKYMRDRFPEMVAIAHDAGKQFIANVAGSTPEEYAILTETALELGADAAEENLGCPNVLKGNGSRKPIASFNPETTERILDLLETRVGKEAPIWIKVSPYSDPELLRIVGGIILRYRVAKAVTAINTFPRAYGFNEKGKSAISVGFAGLSGEPLKHIGLGQVKQWYDILQGEKDIIAVGGIRTGRDIWEYGQVGGVAFQMTTELLKTNDLRVGAFERVAAEYLNLEI
jgi:dihydroorotate dehydrogenase